MSIADKLLQVNQVKQDIKTAIETKGIPMTNVAFTEYANKILDISGGGGGNDVGWDISYEEYALALFYRFGKLAIFSNAWTNHNKRTILFDGNISLEVADGGMAIYSGDGIDELYDLLANGGARVNEVLKITVDNTVYDATSIDSVTNTGVVLRYTGDLDGVYTVTDVIGGIPFLMVLDTTVLGMPFGKAIILGNENVNYLKIESGFNHYYENGIIIPDGVEIVPDFSYNSASEFEVINEYLKNNDYPLVIPNSVIDIGDYAFYRWEANNQPLVIPNSVTSIGSSAFNGWTSNNQPLVIPSSVTSIGEDAFYLWQLVPYVEMQSITPPTLANANAFRQSNAPIYVPDESVEAYKTATNWVDLASRIFPISDR